MYRIFIEAEVAGFAETTLDYVFTADNEKERNGYFDRIPDIESMKKKKIGGDCVAGLCAKNRFSGKNIFWMALCVDVHELDGRKEVFVVRREKVVDVERTYYGED